MSAPAPLLGDKRTSAERVRNDAIDPKETLASPARARDQNNSVFRAQGRLDALEQPLPHVRHGPGEQEEDANDRQIGLHRRRQRRSGYTGQPRILRLQNRI